MRFPYCKKDKRFTIYEEDVKLLKKLLKGKAELKEIPISIPYGEYFLIITLKKKY